MHLLLCTMGLLCSASLSSASHVRKGRGAKYWNITHPTEPVGREKRSFPMVLDLDLDMEPETDFYPFTPGSIFSVAIRVFDYNDDWSQNILLDFPVTYAIPFSHQGFRSFTTSRGDLMAKVEGMAEKLGLDGGACVLRLMCEVNADPVEGGGLIGDIFNLVFRGNVTAESHGSLQTEDFTFARNLARTRSCWRLHRNCPVSLFNLSFFTKP